MEHFIKYTKADVLKYVGTREGETKLGENLNWDNTAKYVVIGIPESIGVRANHGVGGTETAWESFLPAFLNMQSNRFLSGDNIQILGYFDFPQMYDASIAELREYVNIIDAEVSELIQAVVSSGQVPIVIGGGHNNAYGNIKGSSLALNQPVNVVNFDAHADFRALEGRHSGNGFSYAKNEGFLDKYSIFGLKKKYVSEYMLNAFDENVQVHFSDELLTETRFFQALEASSTFLSGKPLGIEIDLDAIENVLSSAISPVGFSVQQCFQFLFQFKMQPSVCYLHLSEGAAILKDDRSETNMGKLLAGLVALFVEIPRIC